MGDLKKKYVAESSKFSNFGEKSPVFGKNIEGGSILKSLYKDLEEKTKEEITSFLENISTMKKDEWENAPKKLPSKVSYYNDVEKSEKNLHAHYRPLWDDKNELTKIMFMIDDKTEIDHLINESVNSEEIFVIALSFSLISIFLACKVLI